MRGEDTCMCFAVPSPDLKIYGLVGEGKAAENFGKKAIGDV